MKLILCAVAAATVFAFAMPAAAQTQGPPSPAANPPASERPDASGDPKPGDKTECKTDPGSQCFAGIKFGVGISVTIDFYGDQRVNAAEVVGGVVRITDEDDARARVMLDSHYFFVPGNSFFGLVDAGSWGFGPFVAVQPGTDEIIEAVALGGMIGFKRGDTGSSFNIGMGIVVDPNTQVLGDGLKANEPLPGGETVIRYREEAQYGLLIMTSFTF